MAVPNYTYQKFRIAILALIGSDNLSIRLENSLEHLLWLNDINDLKDDSGNNNFRTRFHILMHEVSSHSNVKSFVDSLEENSEEEIAAEILLIYDYVAMQINPNEDQKDGMRLSHLREIEEAYEKSWLLSTLELIGLTGLSASTIKDHGERFEEAGFTFTKIENQNNNERSIWKIGKSEK